MIYFLGNMSLVDEENIQNKYIFSDNFPLESFTPYNSEETNFTRPPIKTYTHFKSTPVKIEVPSLSSFFTTPQNTNIINRIQITSPNLKTKCESIETDSSRKPKLRQKHNKITRISKLVKRAKSFSTRNNFKNLMSMQNFSSINSKAMLTMQLKDRGRPWMVNEKKFALKLYCKSPKMYTFLRTLKVNLPGLSTIRRWIDRSVFLPGSIKLYNFSHLRKKL